MLSKEAMAYYVMASRGQCETPMAADAPKGGEVATSTATPKMSGKQPAYVDGPFGGKRPE
jgi:hypothetical protein